MNKNKFQISRGEMGAEIIWPLSFMSFLLHVFNKEIDMNYITDNFV